MSPDSIFGLVRAQDIAAYYTNFPQTEPPYLGDELFPAQKQLGMDLSYIKGANNQPVALRPSAFDAKVVPRGREGFEQIKNRMPFYKESKYIDEELRQQLLLVQGTNNSAYQDVMLNHIFKDQIKLVNAAAISREIVRMQALTTGKATISGNGVSYSYDFYMPDDNKVTATTAWDVAGSNPLNDIKRAKRHIAYKTGQTITRAVMNQRTWDTLLTNETLKSTLFANNANTAASVLLDTQLSAFLTSNTQITFGIYDKGYKDATGAWNQYIPDGVVVFLPNGNLGNTYFGTTPEEADLMGVNGISNVALVDTGVAISTSASVDPVNVEMKVSQLTLPSFEYADSVYVLSGLTSTSDPDYIADNSSVQTDPATSSTPASSAATSDAGSSADPASNASK